MGGVAELGKDFDVSLLALDNSERAVFELLTCGVEPGRVAELSGIGPADMLEVRRGICKRIREVALPVPGPQWLEVWRWVCPEEDLEAGRDFFTLFSKVRCSYQRNENRIRIRQFIIDFFILGKLPRDRWEEVAGLIPPEEWVWAEVVINALLLWRYDYNGKGKKPDKNSFPGRVKNYIEIECSKARRTGDKWRALLLMNAFGHYSTGENARIWDIVRIEAIKKLEKIASEIEGPRDEPGTKKGENTNGN